MPVAPSCRLCGWPLDSENVCTFAGHCAAWRYGISNYSDLLLTTIHPITKRRERMKEITIEIMAIRGGYRALVTASSNEGIPTQPEECYGSTPRTIAAEVRDLIVAALTPAKVKEVAP